MHGYSESGLRIRRASAAVRARAAPVVVHSDRRSATVFVLDGRNPTIRSDIWRTAKDLDVTIKRGRPQHQVRRPQSTRSYRRPAIAHPS